MTLWVRDEAPRFYIDLMGSGSQIANAVADDVTALVKTLKELHPLLVLIRLDQAKVINIVEQLDRESRHDGRLRGGPSGSR